MISFICPICNKHFLYRERNRKYCSRQCMSTDPARIQNAYNIGKKNKGKTIIRKPTKKYTFWTINTKGYKMIKKRFHPSADKRGYIMEHRLIMEEYIGRLLTPQEKVHHKNRNKLDNRVENLVLCSSQSIHIKNHKDVITGKFISIPH